MIDFAHDRSFLAKPIDPFLGVQFFYRHLLMLTVFLLNLMSSHNTICTAIDLFSIPIALSKLSFSDCPELAVVIVTHSQILIKFDGFGV